MAVTVIGLDGRPLAATAAAALARATVVAGGGRHLREVSAPVGAETIELEGGFALAIEAICDRSANGERVVVLASGDPGFFGIVRAVRRAGLAPEVLPGTSSVTLAFARAGLSWDDATVVSAHGRALAPAVNACRAGGTVAVLTGPGAGPREIAAALVGFDRRLFVAEDLGFPAERTRWFTPGEAAGRNGWSSLAVVVVVGPSSTVGTASAAGQPPAAGQSLAATAFPRRSTPPSWALPEDAFAHRASMVTKSEVRAVALARLGPGPGDLVWDVGAGSGSLAVECARFGAAVIAVDRDPRAGDLIAANAREQQVEVEIVRGSAPDALAGLPSPDAVFVGGGGPEVIAACAARSPRSVVAALAAVDRVRPAWEALAAAGYRPGGTQLAASRLAPLPDGALRLAATNPVFLVWGTRP